MKSTRVKSQLGKSINSNSNKKSVNSAVESNSDNTEPKPNSLDQIPQAQAVGIWGMSTFKPTKTAEGIARISIYNNTL
jgi:hypothetical protein